MKWNGLAQRTWCRHGENEGNCRTRQKKTSRQNRRNGAESSNIQRTCLIWISFAYLSSTSSCLDKSLEIFLAPFQERKNSRSFAQLICSGFGCFGYFSGWWRATPAITEWQPRNCCRTSQIKKRQKISRSFGSKSRIMLVM